jgi:hypothetical protein
MTAVQTNKVVSLYGVENEDSKLIELEPPIQYLSFYDLDGVVGFSSAKSTQNKEMLEDILWRHGADISKPYYIKKCLHRPRTSNQPYDGFRIEFTERTDKEYLLSGIASHEAQIFTTDQSLADELASLDPRNARNKKRDFDEDAPCGVDVNEFEEGL